MSKSKDILPTNKEGGLNGYCETYYPDGELDWKGVCINNLRYGYLESCFHDGGIYKHNTGYWMNGFKLSFNNEEGYCYVWNRVEQ